MYPSPNLYPSPGLFPSDVDPPVEPPVPIPPRRSPPELSPTGLRMLFTLPDYYYDNEFVLRVLQAYADTVDRVDRTIDELKDGLVPGLASDTLGMLAIWERILGLPVAPAGTTVAQRQRSIRTAFLRLDAFTGAGVLALISSQGPAFSISRDTPMALQDTLTIGYEEGTVEAAMIQRVAGQAWPAHRQLLIKFDAGFVLGVSLLDQDEM